MQVVHHPQAGAEGTDFPFMINCHRAEELSGINIRRKKL